MAKEYTYYQSAQIPASKDAAGQQPARQVAAGFVPGQRILPKGAEDVLRNGENIRLVPVVPVEMSEENTCDIGAKDMAIGALCGGGFFAATLCCPVVGPGSQIAVAVTSALCGTLFGKRAVLGCIEGCDGKAPMSNAL